MSLAFLISTSCLQKTFLAKKLSGTGEGPRLLSVSNNIQTLLMKSFLLWCDDFIITQINISPQTLLLYKFLCSVYTLPFVF